MKKIIFMIIFIFAKAYANPPGVPPNSEPKYVPGYYANTARAITITNNIVHVKDIENYAKIVEGCQKGLQEKLSTGFWPMASSFAG